MSGSEDASNSANVNERIELMYKAITYMGNTFRDYMEYQMNYGNQSSPFTGHQNYEQEVGSEQLPLVRQFQNLNPSSFMVATEPTMAETWIIKFEKIFKILKCSDQKKVELVVFMLEGEADDW